MSPSGKRQPSSPSDGAPRRVEERRALGVGFTISLALHVLAIGLYASAVGTLPLPDTPREPTPPRRQPLGVELVTLPDPPVIEEPQAAEPLPPAPQEPPEPAPDEPPLTPASVVVDATQETEEEEERVVVVRDLTVAERLQPRMGDPRLWAGVDRHFSELTDFERADLLLRGMIRTWNDSVAVAEALANRARDWTYTDSDGRRWGLASGRLYLGDFSIPLPFSFEVPPDQRREWAGRQWLAQDLAQGAVVAQIRETWADRARAIRERLEADRAAARDVTSDRGNGR